MKRERVVGLCICVLLLGSLQAVWSVATGLACFRTVGQARAMAGEPQMAAYPNLAAAMALSAYPPLGFFFSEQYFLKMKNPAAHHVRKAPKNNPAEGNHRGAKSVSVHREVCLNQTGG
jgi:hypothetical protein